jgi:hypothetical protein
MIFTLHDIVSCVAIYIEVSHTLSCGCSVCGVVIDDRTMHGVNSVQLRQDSEMVNFLCLHLHETTDVCGGSLFMVFIWSSALAVWRRDCYGKARGEDQCQGCHASCLEVNIPFMNLCQLLDGTLAMTSENVGFTGHYIKDPTVPDSVPFISKLCVHKVINFQCPMSASFCRSMVK